jgi:hypothetical protein
MAPEIFGTYKEDLKADAFSMKADVYSAGIVCFEILSREVLFSAVQPAVLYKEFAALVLLRLRLPSSCPTNLVPLICACWDGNPRKRSAFADVCRVLRCLKGLLMTGTYQLITQPNLFLLSVIFSWPDAECLCNRFKAGN